MKLLEVLGLSLMAPTAVFDMIAVLTREVFEHDDIKSRSVIVQTMEIVILIVANFLTNDYLPHLAVRQIYMLLSITGYVFTNLINGELNLYAAATFVMLINLGIETIIYVNHKSKAQLFMRMKVLMLQQEQLKSLFDTVPDKVLIFSKTSEARAPKSLYSNR